MEDSLETILLGLWAAFFPRIGVRRAEPPELEEALRTAIDFRGEWAGTLLISAPPALVRRLTAEFYARPPEDCGEERQRDLLCEIANVVGGNLRAGLPSRPEMSLPRVVEEPPADPPAHRLAL